MSYIKTIEIQINTSNIAKQISDTIADYIQDTIRERLERDDYPEGTIDDIIAKVPSAYRQEILDDVEVINNYVKEQMDEIYFYYNQVKDIESDKEFAITCKKLGFPKKITGRVLALRKGQEINILRSRSGKYIKSYKIFKEV